MKLASTRAASRFTIWFLEEGLDSSILSSSSLILRFGAAAAMAIVTGL